MDRANDSKNGVPRWKEPRDIVGRYVVEGRLSLCSPTHLGGADPDATSERPLVRDGDGEPYLAATSLKGVLRQYMEADEAPGSTLSSRLFGSSLDKGCQASLLVEDARLEQPVWVELRDSVALDPALGIAAARKKYDLELLPAGTVFVIRLELLMPKENGRPLLEGFVRLLQFLRSEGVWLGARTRRGFGRVKALETWRWSFFDLTEVEGLKAHLAEGLSSAPPSWRQPLEKGSLQQLANQLGVTLPALKVAGWETITLSLRLRSSILIRSEGRHEGPADYEHLHAARSGNKKGEPVVPGTALAGALRSRCLRIVRTLGVSDGLIEGLFGPRDIKAGKGQASRLRVEEATIREGCALRHTRVRIDPLTGGASEHLLYTAEPWYGGHFSTTLHWKKPKERKQERAERALLLFALRDLALGELPLGGEAGTGRGGFAPGGANGHFGQLEAIPLVLNGGGLEGAKAWDEDVKALITWGRAEND